VWAIQTKNIPYVGVFETVVAPVEYAGGSNTLVRKRDRSMVNRHETKDPIRVFLVG
jgi:hypothetical protein